MSCEYKSWEKSKARQSLYLYPKVNESMFLCEKCPLRLALSLRFLTFSLFSFILKV